MQEFLIAIAIKNLDCAITVDGLFENMVNREILVKDKDDYLITQHWSEVLDEILADSGGTVDRSDEELMKLAQKMRDCYPQGKMRDRYGKVTPYYYRCNNAEVVKKLKKFFTLFGNSYSDEDLITATKRYVASFNGNYTGMRLIKYFILKDDVRPTEDGNHVEQISDLLTFLENGESEEGEVTNSDDWLTNTRN